MLGIICFSVSNIYYIFRCLIHKPVHNTFFYPWLFYAPISLETSFFLLMLSNWLTLVSPSSWKLSQQTLQRMITWGLLHFTGSHPESQLLVRRWAAGRQGPCMACSRFSCRTWQAVKGMEMVMGWMNNWMNEWMKDIFLESWQGREMTVSQNPLLQRLSLEIKVSSSIFSSANP